jgi:predicted permease
MTNHLADRLSQHARYAVRAMITRPGFSLAAILTLGVGIGFNTVIFTIFYSLVYRELPVREPERLVNVYQQLGGEYSRSVNGMTSMISYPEFLGYSAAIDAARPKDGAIAGAAVYAPVRLAFDRSSKGQIGGEYVSCDYFRVVGARIAMGRGLAADDCRSTGSAPVAVVAHEVWTRELGADSTVVGKLIRLNQVPVQVIGVAEPGFGGLNVEAAGVWVPVTMQPTLAHGRDSILVKDWSWLVMAARLTPTGTVERARAELALSARQRDALYPGRRTSVYIAKGAMLNAPEMRARLAPAAALIGVLGFLVVAMVCANLMGLLLARGMARRREIGIRLAIGASRGRLIEQLLTESTLLALLGGVLGFLIVLALPPLVARFIPLTGLQLDLRANGAVLGFSAVASVVTALIFGLLPALQATSVDLVSATKGGMGLAWGNLRPSRMRSAVVGVQVAGSALLLIVASLFIRGASRAATVSPGYAVENVVSFGMNFRQLGYTPERTRVAVEAMRDRIAALPNVASVGLAAPLPLLGRSTNPMRADGVPDSAQYRVDDGAFATVSGNYLATMQIPLLAGRSFTDADTRAAGKGERPVVVSRSLAERLWPGQNAIGRRMLMASDRHVVVGVAADARNVDLGRDTPFAYVPGLAGEDDDLRLIVVRVKGAIAQVEQLVPAMAREMDASIVVDAQRMSERLDKELTPARISSAVAAAMGSLALLLAMVGIYGVVSFAVAQRAREVAVRLALGSSRRDVVRLMMRQGATPVAAGLAVGIVVSIGVAAGIQSLLLGLSPVDPVAYVGISAVLMTAALSAMYIPARRAASVDPALPLRAE